MLASVDPRPSSTALALVALLAGACAEPTGDVKLVADCRTRAVQDMVSSMVRERVVRAELDATPVGRRRHARAHRHGDVRDLRRGHAQRARSAHRSLRMQRRDRDRGHGDRQSVDRAHRAAR
jgi:hypothetical protein